MADEYTPTTDEVRERSAGNTPGEIEDGYAEFDRWLAAHDAALRERIAQDIEAEAEYEEVYGCRAMHEAARIARGATR